VITPVTQENSAMSSKGIEKQTNDLKQVIQLLDKVLTSDDLKPCRLEKKDLEAVRQIVSSVRRRLKASEV
jgi:hypothetical protein